MLLKTYNSSLSIEDNHYNSQMFRQFIPNIYLQLATLILNIDNLVDSIHIYSLATINDKCE